MSLNETTQSKENNMEELKAKLDEFIAQNSITQFESEDIVELIEEGEGIDWIVDQLKGNNPDIDADKITPLLRDIKTLVGPVKEPEYPDEEPGDNEAAGEPEIEAGMPDLSRIDPAQLDLSQLAHAMPPGVKLPPGFDMKQIRDMMESPQGKIMSDFLLFCREKGVEIDENTMNDPRMQNLQDEWKSTPRDALDGKTPSQMLEENPGLMPGKVETYRREEPRVGRNDPCPCGSGKKYKKCCGRG